MAWWFGEQVGGWMAGWLGGCHCSGGLAVQALGIMGISGIRANKGIRGVKVIRAFKDIKGQPSGR